MKLRAHLVALVLAVLVPMVLATAIVIALLGTQQRAAAERGAVETARALMNALDENLRNSITTLEALASSETLHADDLRAFDALARRVLPTQPDWYDIILLGRDARTIVDTQSPYGAPSRPASEPASVHEVVATGRPVVGSVAPGPLGHYAVPVRVPVMRDGRVVHVLTAVVKPESFLAVLRRQRTDAQWVIGAFDRRNIIVARTRGLAEFLGRPVSPEFAALLARGSPEGWAMTRTLEGGRVYTAYARSAVTGWGIGIGIPVEAVDAPLRRSLFAVAGVGVALFGLALGLALLVGRRITQPMAELAAAARRFGEGAPMRADAPARVQEVEEVRHAFVGAAELVRQRAAEAEAAARAKDQYRAMLGHELRNPLAAIASAEHLLDVANSPELRSRARAVIARQIEHLRRLVDDLLDVGRVMTGKISLVIAPVDLATVVARALDALHASGASQRHAITTTLEPGWVNGDGVRLEQIVTNLVGNALKFTPPGRAIDVMVRREDRDVVLRVVDEGSGMSSEVIARAFDLFAQGSDGLSRPHGGLGIGLTLVRNLAALHGGTVQAESRGRNQGSVFTVRLPAIEAPPARIAEPAAGAAATARRIVVVEDNDDAREMLTILLRLAGHDVFEASDGESGVETILRLRPDVAFIDVGLPGADGYAVARRIRAGADWRPKLVAVTGYALDEDRRRAEEAGFDVHVAKPVDPDVIRTLLNA
jgi:signal transduction histidine kinase